MKQVRRRMMQRRRCGDGCGIVGRGGLSDDEPTDGAEAQLDGVDGTSSQPRKSAGKDDTPEADADPTRSSLPKTSPPAPRPRAPRRLGGIIPREPECRWGPRRTRPNALSVLAELGMTTVREFLSHPPKDHIKVRQANLTVPVDGAELGADDLDAAEDGEAVMVRGRVIHRFVRLTANGARVPQESSNGIIGARGWAPHRVGGPSGQAAWRSPSWVPPSRAMMGGHSLRLSPWVLMDAEAGGCRSTVSMA